MNRAKKASIYGLMTIMLGVVYLSCKKDSVTDLETYVANNLAAYSEIPINSGDTIISNQGLLIQGKKNAGFPVLLKKAIGSDLEVIARIDNNPELIRVYDSLYRTHSMLLPDGLFKIKGSGRLFVKAGQTQSADSVFIEMDNISSLKSGNYTYIIPLSLESKGKDASLKSKLMFVRYQFLVSRLDVSLQNTSGIRNILLLNTPDVDRNIFIQAVSNRSLSRDITVSVEKINNKEFIDTYNAANGTNYLPFPEAGYILLQPATIIPAGRKVSTQSMQVQLTDLSLFNPASSYLLGLKLKEDKIAAVGGDMVYISIASNNIEAGNAGLVGEPIDRTGWKVDALGYYDAFLPSSIIDGNSATAWDSDGRLPQWLTLDMGAEQNVKGFTVVPNYIYPDDDFLRMEVLSSTDGVKWKFEGIYTGTATSAQSTSANPDFKTVKFISPVTARYFKFNILETTEGTYTGMGELFGIK